MSSPLPEEKLLTAEEFAELSFEGKAELIDGRVVRSETMPGASHSRCAACIVTRLKNWAESANAGEVFVEGGYILARGHQRDRVRLPDVSFVRRERILDVPRGFLTIPPDLAVEIVSPTDRIDELDDKLDDYRQFGVPLIWVVNPTKRTLIAHLGPSLARIYRGDEVVDGGEVLPGFSCPLPRLFE